MTVRTLAHAQAVAALLSRWGVPAVAEYVEDDPYIRVGLSYDGLVRAWIDPGDLEVAYARVPNRPPRLVRGPGSCVDGHACDDAHCVAEQLWEWVICWRACPPRRTRHP
ncbi:hypothetical protein ACT17Q_00600 [Cellulomonas sp. CW35]|uniref:hypothetical protein n=1 Tax=Cellulomonas sp. CW35 TaxID=3458249 RepID=UPI00403355F5